MRSRSQRALQARRSKRSKRLVLSVFLLLGLILFGTGVFAYLKIDSFLDDITINAEPVEEGTEVDTEFTEEPFAMVLLGMDSRKGTGTLNTDVMIVAVVRPEEKKVVMVSIPRDTRVVIPGYSGYHKVNSAYAKGEMERLKAERKGEPVTVTGTGLVKKTLEGFLGIPVKHYVLVDFEGFKAVIDKLGGVEINVKRRMVYHDPTDGTSIDLYPGLQVLDGQKALDYVRHRHDDRGTKYYSSDFERNERQQEVIRAVVDKAKSFKGIANFFGILEVAGEHIRTDFSKEQIKGLAMTYHSIGSENIQSLEVDAYWDAGTGFTLFRQDNLDMIRRALWSAMEMSEEEGKALLNEKNDASQKTTEKKSGTKKSVNESRSHAGESRKGAEKGTESVQKQQPAPLPKEAAPDPAKEGQQEPEAGEQPAEPPNQPTDPDRSPPSNGSGAEPIPQPEGTDPGSGGEGSGTNHPGAGNGAGNPQGNPSGGNSRPQSGSSPTSMAP